MNSLGAGTLTARELASVVAEVDALVTDADTAVAVTYYPKGARAYDPARGTVSYADSGASIIAHLGPVDLDEVQGAELGDVKILIAFGDITDEPGPGDRFRAGSTTYAVYAAQTGPLSSHYTAYGRKVT